MYLEIIASVVHAVGAQKEVNSFVIDFLENLLYFCEKEVVAFVSCIYITLVLLAIFESTIFFCALSYRNKKLMQFECFFFFSYVLLVE